MLGVLLIGQRGNSRQSFAGAVRTSVTQMFTGYTGGAFVACVLGADWLAVLVVDFQDRRGRQPGASAQLASTDAALGAKRLV